MRSRKRLFGSKSSAVAALAIASLVLTACGSDTAVDSSAGTGAGSSQDGVVSSDSAELLVLGIRAGTARRFQDPHNDQVVEAKPMLRAVYDTLVTFTTADLSEPEPWLAESYVANADATVFTFTLREGLQFSDGTPLTSADVVWSLNRLANISTDVSFLMNGITPSATDARTVVLSVENPMPWLPVIMTSPNAAVMNSAVMIAQGASDGTDGRDATTETGELFLAENNSVGSGPYVLVSWDPQTDMVFARNENFWGPAPRYERIVFRNMEPSIQRLSLANGEIDVALSLTQEEVSSLQGNNDVEMSSSAGTNLVVLMTNFNQDVNPVGANPAFREAMRYAIDYDALLELGGPAAVRPCGPVIKQMFGSLPADDSTCVAHDPERARAILTEAGLIGESIEISWAEGDIRDGITMADASTRVGAQLAKVGMRVTLDGLPAAVENDKRNSDRTQMRITGVSIRYADPCHAVGTLEPGGSFSKFGDGRERSGWMPDEDAGGTVLSLGKAACSEGDPAKRRELFYEWQRRINTDSPFVSLAQGVAYVGVRKGVLDAAVHPLWFVDVPTLTGAVPQ